MINFIAVCLWLGHVAASLAFFFALRRYAASAGVSLHWALGAILLAYPGLIAHTSVTLTDTFCADLVMLAFSLLAVARSLDCWRRPLVQMAGGAALGYAVLCRPSFEPAAFVAVLLSPLLFAAIGFFRHRLRGQEGAVRASEKASARRGGRRDAKPVASVSLQRGLSSLGLAGAAVFAGGFALLVVPAELHCAARFNQRCLMDPSQSRASLLESLQTGSFSPRQYWTRYADQPNLSCGPGCRVLRDETLWSTWAAQCQPSLDEVGYGVPACFLRRPDLGTMFLAKKTLALFDSYQLQDYAVDLTSRWARLWSRPFGAAAYAGFVLCLVWLMWILRDGRFPELAPLVGFTVALGLVHSLTHIEGRYGYGAVPGALLALVWLMTAAQSARARRALQVGVGCLALLFFVQTSFWDQADTVMQRIEANLAK